ncbi:DUF4367 domain-containing protein [Faecalimonas sp.]
MDGPLTPEEKRILQAIDNGSITKDRLEGGLKKLIEDELNQNERPVNSELLEACQSLLFRLNDYKYVSNKEESMKTVKKRLAIKDKRQRLRYNMLKIAAVFIFIMSGTLIVDAFLLNGRLISYSTEDEQQYVVEADAVEGQFTPVVLADGSRESNITQSDEMERVSNLLGYTPKCPTWLPEGWIPLDYYASTSLFTSIFKVQYVNREKNDTYLIKYSEIRYESVEECRIAFEQNHEGRKYEWENAVVNISLNIDTLIATWIKENTCYSISGPLTIEEIKHIFKSII